MTQEQITKAVEDVFDKKLGKLYIDRQTHFEDHLFIKDWREWTESIKSTALKTIVKAAVGFLLGAMVLGFAVWRGYLK